ncbi:MAG: DUF4253 domain-containing protein [Pseudomonadota bacterium]
MRLLVLLASLLPAACGDGTAELTEAERSLVETLQFDAELMASIRAKGQSFEQLQGESADWEAYPAAGLTVTTKPAKGRATLRRIRKLLEGSDYTAYLHNVEFGNGPDTIAILKGGDPYDYLALVRTNGINYDLTHETVLERYREWDERYGFRLTGAGRDWLDATFTQPPEDWLAFAQEVDEFCPDLVDQGTGDVAALAKEMRRANSLYLWWD